MDSHSKVFITGINGFTGIYLSKYFADKNFEVFGLANHNESKNPNIYICDLLEKEKLNAIIKEIQPNIVIHLAAISFVGHKNLSEMYDVNVLGTQNLLEAIKNEAKNSIRKVILASSATVYGNQSETILSENLSPNPINHYGISKLAMEFTAKTYFDTLPIIITRPFNYTAPEQNINFVIPKITKAFKEKASILELGNINVYREYNSINFICECYYKLAISNFYSEIVNLCSGKTHSLNEIINICTKISKHNLEIKINPDFVRSNEIYKLSGSPEKLYGMISLTNDYSIEDTLNKNFAD
ncbi:GDP-mannose 4,6-dehydratase [Flavobacterium sp.]|uniref:GDP-mannose 4,6-dehydratase n=1 Tax=Flavobacterium sp. TaxID=239 RepID=UPI00374FFE61